MADPTDIGQVAGNPWPVRSTPPDELTMQALLVSTGRRIGAMPTDWSSYAAQLVVVAADGSGPVPTGSFGSGSIDLGGLAVRNGKTEIVTITGSGLLSDLAHRGRDLVFASTSAATLTITPDPAGRLGVTSGFNCHLYAAYDGGSVGQLRLSVGAGITLQRPDGFLRVPPGGGVAIKLVGTRLFLGNAVA